jgi:hypothetical protein
VIDTRKLILAKRAAGRPKDLIALRELEAIQEAQAKVNQTDQHQVVAPARSRLAAIRPKTSEP